MIELSNCLWIPKRDFTADMRDRLTVSAYSLDGTTTEVEAFRTDRKGFIGLPRVYGLKLISNSDFVDRRSKGKAVKFPKTIKLRDYQEPFVASMMDASVCNTDFVAEAATGKGKTVCGLAVAQRRGRTTAVVVDQENLLDQWIERIEQHLGLPRDQIGIVRGKVSTYEGKPITICMMQTLRSREMPDDFYTSFGTVIFDECHTAGAPTFSRTLMMFAAEVRFGLSATPDRKDELLKLIRWNLGTVDVQLTDTPNKSAVYIMESHGVYSWRVNNSKMVGGFINELVDDGERNRLIVKATKWLYESGRDVLVISDRVEHLCSLMALAEASGIPKHSLGLYAKSRTVFAWQHDPRPPRKPVGWEKGTEFTPIKMALVQKTIPKKVLPEVMQRARVIFATYGIMAKGVDIPRLSAGIDATPRSEATQVHGRVLRTAPGKLKPIWVTIADVNSFRSLYQLSNRLGDYDASNAEVFLWEINKGRKPLAVAQYRKELASRISSLRQSQITMSLDGNNTLLIPSTATDSGSLLGRRTAKTNR